MARPSATDRLTRILSIVPWVAERGGASIAELCERFDVSKSDLLADFAIVPFVGLYPYSPDALIELIVDDDHVSLTYGNFFERPLRLSKEEALTIIAAGKASAARSGHDPDGPLSRGLTKIARVLGVDLDDDIDVVLGEPPAQTRQLLEDAIRDRHVLHLGYFSHARDELTERDVEPLRLHHLEGAWYLDAHCRSAEEHRVFRVDRITEVAPTGDSFDARDRRLPEGVAFAPDADLPRVTIETSAAGAWLAEQYPVEERVDLDDGGVRVTLAVSARPWLDRVLLRLGPDGRVVATSGDDTDSLTGAGTVAARRLLDRYTD